MDLDSDIPAYDELPDHKLMKLVAQGDQDAFDQVYLRYKSKVRRLIGGFVEDDATAEDILQETFLRVYQNAYRYRPTHKLASWVYRIATNLCLNEIRRRRTHPVISLNQQIQVAMTDSENETVELHELIPDVTSTGPLEVAESAETVREIMSALATLSNVQQEVITMRLWDELNYQEIAGALNVSVGTAKSRTFYGLRALRDKLEDDE